jgi:hypothetical protein
MDGFWDLDRVIRSKTCSCLQDGTSRTRREVPGGLPASDAAARCRAGFRFVSARLL